MDNGVSILKIAGAMARHAGHLHQVTASNIARADIPGARQARIESFELSLAELERGGEPRSSMSEAPLELERELLTMAEARGRHDAALAVWKSTLTMMRLAAGAPQA